MTGEPVCSERHERNRASAVMRRIDAVGVYACVMMNAEKCKTIVQTGTRLMSRIVSVTWMINRMASEQSSRIITERDQQPTTLNCRTMTSLYYMR